MRAPLLLPLLRFVLLLGLVRHAPTSTAATQGAPRPNIILVMTDDQGYGEMSCHGNPILQTPALDRLHAASARFTDFTVSPTCAPTRAALLTGRHEFRSGITHTIFERERLNLHATTLAEVLRSAGYATGIFGKWHLGDEPDRQPDRRGFDETFIHGAGGIGQTYGGSCGDAPDNQYFNPVLLHNGRFEKTQGYCTDVFFRQALDWITAQQRADRPFFAYITPNAPHDPFVSPGPAYEEPFRNRGLGTNQVQYYAMIRNIDDNVGRLLDHLRDRQLDRSTLVIFLTDNGHSVPSLYNAGMRAAKGTPYRGGTRVPSFWHWPGRITPGDRPQAAAHLDVLPTLAALTHARVPARVRRQWEGRSLVPALDNPAARWPDRTFITHVGRWPSGEAEAWKHRGAAIRAGNFKLVNNTELYDLATDPAESRNIADDHPRIVRRLRTTYDRWWRDVLPDALENDAVRGPAINPFKERYWQQYGGGPDDRLRGLMNPDRKFQPTPRR